VHELADLPRSLNPSSGYVQNANNPPRFSSVGNPIDMGKFPSYVERGALGLRPQLALRMLEGQPRFSVDDVMRLKFDTRVLLAERVRPALIQILRDQPSLGADARSGLATLEAWDDRASADSRGAGLFFRFWDIYAREVRQPFAIQWDDARPVETPTGVSDPVAAVRAFEAAVRSMREIYGSERVAWGELNRYRIGDIDLPGEGCSGTYGCFRVQRFESSAAADAPSIAGNLSGAGTIGFGDAWVLLVDFSTPVPTAWSLLAYGQTTDLASPHSRDQIALLAARKLRRAYFTEADVRANLEREYRPPR
jgi:acyl-homoserine-lactone acylase